MTSQFDIGPYDPCPCGSGEKYKFCCAKTAKSLRHGKYPIGTVAYYGPDATTTVKIAAGVILRDGAEPLLKRWVGTNVTQDPKVAEELKRFFAQHGVKSVVAVGRNIGCPHEEGEDFPLGGDCPLCPFWAGKQGTARRTTAPAPPLWSVEVVPPETTNTNGAADEGAADSEADDAETAENDAQLARIDAIVGAEETTWETAQDRLFAHLKANLTFPCEVTGVEDFKWEEPYVFGGWSNHEYKRLKRTQPSYTDRYRLLSIARDVASRWMIFPDDLAARVERISDGKLFVLGLSELEATDAASPNAQLLNDYAVWFANSR